MHHFVLVKKKADISKAMIRVEAFGSFSGLMLNRVKIQGNRIMVFRITPVKVYGKCWTDKPVKANGIYFVHERHESENLN